MAAPDLRSRRGIRCWLALCTAHRGGLNLDGELLRLRRLLREDQGDVWARYRYRLECVRSGRTELAGLEVGDVVSVLEVESPWVRGAWRGQVLRVFDAGDKYVRPIDRELPYRVRPSAEYLAKGLYLTREDKATLVVPALPGADSESAHQEGRAAA